MKLRKRGALMKIGLAFLGGAAILIGWAEFIFKPIRFYAKQHDLSLGVPLPI